MLSEKLTLLTRRLSHKISDLRDSKMYPLYFRLLVATFAFGFVTVVNYPGLGNNDSYTHISDFIVGNPTDQHGVAMTSIWKAIFALTGSLNGFFVLLNLLVLMSSALFLIRFKYAKWSILFAFLPLSPWFINSQSVVVKDTLLASLLLLVSSLIFFPATRVRLMLVAFLLAVALTSRFNAAFAVAPFLVFVVWGWGLLQSGRSRVVGLLIFTASFLVISSVMTQVVDPRPSFPENQIVVDDLLSLSLSAGESLIPNRTLSEIEACNEFSSFGLEKNQAIRCLNGWGLDERSLREESLVSEWVVAVSKDPATYVSSRSSKFIDFLRLNGKDPIGFFQNGTTHVNRDNLFGWEHRPNEAFLQTKLYVTAFAQLLSPLFTAWFWLLLGTALLLSRFARTARTIGARINLPIITVLGSCVSYLGGYFVLATSAEMRFYLWPIWGILSILAVLSVSRTRRN